MSRTTWWVHWFPFTGHIISFYFCLEVASYRNRFLLGSIQRFINTVPISISLSLPLNILFFNCLYVTVLKLSFSPRWVRVPKKLLKATPIFDSTAKAVYVYVLNDGYCLHEDIYATVDLIVYAFSFLCIGDESERRSQAETFRWASCNHTHVDVTLYFSRAGIQKGAC